MQSAGDGSENEDLWMYSVGRVLFQPLRDWKRKLVYSIEILKLFREVA